MRFRGMPWRPLGGMAAAMVLSLAPVLGLLGLGILPGAVACGVYCTAVYPAMVVAMLFRLDLYMAGHARHLAHAA
jgi:hypothetical protein